MIREVGNPNKSHKYTVQCVLPINLFNEQIFIIIWFWYMLVLFWNIAEMFVWISRSVPSKANKWISKRVYLINQSIKVRQNRLKHFLDIYLEQDGIFMIRMIANNTSDYVATDLIHHLWCQHADNYDKLFPRDPHNIPDIPCPFEHRRLAHTKKTDNDDSPSAEKKHQHQQLSLIADILHRRPTIDATGQQNDTMASAGAAPGVAPNPAYANYRRSFNHSISLNPEMMGDYGQARRFRMIDDVDTSRLLNIDETADESRRESAVTKQGLTNV